MGSTSTTITLHLDERLRKSPRQATSMSLPSAVHHRLDVLAEFASAVNPSRAEIIGMLIAEAEIDSEKLEHQILAYRKLRVRDVVPDRREEATQPSDESESNVISLPVRRAGRPPRKATS